MIPSLKEPPTPVSPWLCSMEPPFCPSRGPYHPSYFEWRWVSTQPWCCLLHPTFGVIFFSNPSRASRELAIKCLKENDFMGLLTLNNANVFQGRPIQVSHIEISFLNGFVNCDPSVAFCYVFIHWLPGAKQKTQNKPSNQEHWMCGCHREHVPRDQRSICHNQTHTPLRFSSMEGTTYETRNIMPCSFTSCFYLQSLWLTRPNTLVCSL